MAVKARYDISLTRVDDGIKGDPTGVTESKTAPTSPYTGMLWRDISTSTPLLKKWDGKAWVIFELYAENLKVESLDAVAAKVGTLESSFTDEKLIWLEADSSRDNSKASGTQVFTKGLMDLDYTFSFSETGWSSSGSGSSTYGYNGLDVNIKEKWIGDSGTSDITRRATFNEAGEEFHSTATDGKIEWRYGVRADPTAIDFSSIITTKSTGKQAITGIKIGPAMGISAEDGTGRKDLSLTQIKGLADPKYMYAKVSSATVASSSYPRETNSFNIAPIGSAEYIYLVWRMYDNDATPTAWIGYSAITEIPVFMLEDSLPIVLDQVVTYQINANGDPAQVVVKQVQLYKNGTTLALRGVARNGQGKQKWWGLEKVYCKWFNI